MKVAPVRYRFFRFCAMQFERNAISVGEDDADGGTAPGSLGIAVHVRNRFRVDEVVFGELDRGHVFVSSCGI